MFENPRRGRQARNFTTNDPKILDLKSSSEQIFSRKLQLGAPDESDELLVNIQITISVKIPRQKVQKVFSSLVPSLQQ